MYFLLAVIVTGLISYFLPMAMWNTTWTEIIDIIHGKYNNDYIKQMEIIKKYGIQNDYTKFFNDRLSILLILTFFIFIALIIICIIIKKAVNKNNIKKTTDDFHRETNSTN